MSIQTLRTASKGGKGRQVVGLVGSLALAAVVAAGIVIGWSGEQSVSTETAVTGGQAIQGSSALPADTLGGVAERTQLQAQLAAPQPDTMGGIAEQVTIQRQLDDAAQANVMGGVAERITMQEQMAASR